jgi:hypothetical protein
MEPSTELKSIRFPKAVVEILDSYSRKEFGLPFSKFILHMAVEKVDEIKKEKYSIPLDLLQLITSYYEVEKQIKEGSAKPLRTKKEISNLLDSWK